MFHSLLQVNCIENYTFVLSKSEWSECTCGFWHSLWHLIKTKWIKSEMAQQQFYDCAGRSIYDCTMALAKLGAYVVRARSGTEILICTWFNAFRTRLFLRLLFLISGEAKWSECMSNVERLMTIETFVRIDVSAAVVVANDSIVAKLIVSLLRESRMLKAPMSMGPSGSG